MIRGMSKATVDLPFLSENVPHHAFSVEVLIKVGLGGW
jgi:hypothetical protein